MTRVMVTSNENETITAGEELAHEISKIKTDRSIIIFLEGELGAGKTTFTKGILKGFNYKELLKVLPTILLKYTKQKNIEFFILIFIESLNR